MPWVVKFGEEMELEELVSMLTKKIVEEMKHSDKNPNTLVLVKKRVFEKSSFADQLGSSRNLFYLDDDCRDLAFNEYILPQLSCSQMADLAMGKATGRTGGKVLELILKGKTVNVIEYEYKKYCRTAPEALLRHYESLEKQLNDFGIRKLKRKSAKSLRLRQKVLTQQDLTAAVQQAISQVEVAKDTCITPLAEEFASDHGIKIQRR